MVEGAAGPACRAGYWHVNAAADFLLYLKTDKGRRWGQKATGANRQENNFLAVSCGCD